MIKRKLELGEQATDDCTGFKGVVTARCEYLNGAPLVRLELELPSGKGTYQAHWFSEERLTPLYFRFADLKSEAVAAGLKPAEGRHRSPFFSR